MKAILTILALLLLSTTIYAQEPRLKIVLEDGTSLLLPMDSISSMKFTDHLDLPQYNALRFQPHRMTDTYFDHVYLRDIDSIYFRIENGIHLMHFQTIEGELLGLDFHYSSLHVDPMYYGYGRDSMTFHTFRKNDALVEIPLRQEVIKTSSWSNGRLYAGDSIRRLELNADFSVRTEVMIDPDNSSFIELNAAGSKMLLIRPRSVDYPIKLEGQLVEKDLLSSALDTLSVDKSISSARYLPGTNDVIYFTWDRIDHSTLGQWGFYRLNRETGTTSFLFKPTDRLGSYAPIGFDVTDDGTKLLYTLENLVLERDLSTGISQTVAVLENKYIDWVEYSHAEDRIVYATDIGYDEILHRYIPAEAGIIDRQTHAVKKIEIAPDNEMPWYLIMPRWSSDDKAVSFSSGLQTLASMYPYIYQRLYVMRLP
jgi:hypothetical protein